MPPVTPAKKAPPASSSIDSPWLVDETFSPGLIDTSLQDLNLADTPLTAPRTRTGAGAGAAAKARPSIVKPLKARPSWGTAPVLDANSSAKARGKMRFLHDLENDENNRARVSVGAAAAAPVAGSGGKPAARPRFSLFSKNGLPTGLPAKKETKQTAPSSDKHHDQLDDQTTVNVDSSRLISSDLADQDDGDDAFLRDALLSKSTTADPAPQSPGRSSSSNAKETPEQVQRQLFELRRMNQVFEAYEKMLRGSAGQIEAFAKRVSDTDDLLNIYIELLRETEKTQQLLQDGDWKGSTEDETAHALSLALAERETQRLQAEAQAREQAAAAAAAEAAQRAAEEEAARKEEARRQAERAGTRGRGRGVSISTRGTRGGLARGASTTTTTASRGRGIPRPSVAAASGRTSTSTAPTRGGGTGIGRGRPSTTTTGTGTTRTSSSGIPTRTSSGPYANVRSSGYGPR